MAAPIIIDTGVVLPWALAAGIIGWFIIEIRKEWKALKGKVDTKLDRTECERRLEEEKEARIRERQAVLADREVRDERD